MSKFDDLMVRLKEQASKEDTISNSHLVEMLDDELDVVSGGGIYLKFSKAIPA